jgi:hypothetical protein
MASQWQGSLVWWSFEPKGRVEEHVETSLRHFVSAVVGNETRSLARKASQKAAAGSRSKPRRHRA